MDTPSAPSLTLIMKCWHEICRQTNFSVRPRRSHSSIPTAVQLRRRVERRSRMAAAWRPPAGLVLDGREHGGRLRRAGQMTNTTASRFHFPCPLQQSGSGSGKPIKCRARGLIKKRDPAHEAQRCPGQAPEWYRELAWPPSDTPWFSLDFSYVRSECTPKSRI